MDRRMRGIGAAGQCPAAQDVAGQDVAAQDVAGQDVAAQELAGWLDAAEFPCVGARSALHTGGITVVRPGRLVRPRAIAGAGAAVGTAAALAAALSVAADRAVDARAFRSLVAVFPEEPPLSEREFEQQLWALLQAVHEVDRSPWATGFSDDPQHPEFGYSHAGAAWFVVGMHPGASRVARRSPCPAVAFNRHALFRALRAGGRYERMQEVVRRRDVRLQGGINPNLAEWGEVSEARQYSGRLVPADWRAPFAPRRFARRTA